MDASANGEASVSVVEPQDSARRRVLASPELVDVIFRHCARSDVVRMSLVNRFLEAVSAPRMYRKVTLGASGWSYDHSFWSCFDHKTPNTRHNKYISYARALYLEPEPIDYDLSSYSFARVEIVEHLPRTASPRNYTGGKPWEARYDDDENLAKVIGENMAKLLDLRPSTVIDMSCYTVPVYGPRWEEWSLDDSSSPFPIPSASPASPLKECPGIIDRHATRLVMSPDALHHTIDPCHPLIEVSRLTQLRAFYPNLVEIVIRLDHPPAYVSLLPGLVLRLLTLVRHGYGVVLAGYQAENRAKKLLTSVLLDRKRRSVPLSNCDPDLVDKVHTMSLRQYRASPYGRYPQSTPEFRNLIRLEERYVKARSAKSRHVSRQQGGQ